jgi:hypothetical protein
MVPPLRVGYVVGHLAEYLRLERYTEHPLIIFQVSWKKAAAKNAYY